MSLSDKIQLTLAIIAGVSAILAFFGILSSNKQIKLQKQQWEFSYKPVIKVSYVMDTEKNCRLILENTNNVFLKLKSVKYTDENIEIDASNYGRISITDSRTKERKNYEGINVILKKNNEITSGCIEIIGIDALGNDFKAVSEKIMFKESALSNRFDIQDSFLINK